MKVTLPWPDSNLSPNARVHWSKAAQAKSAARKWAGMATLADIPLQARQAIAEGDGPILMKITFYPPDKRRRDDDNAVAGFKAARDGIADALGVDDNRFRPSYFFEQPEKPGRVEVRFL